jgi:hypothetical protein
MCRWFQLLVAGVREIQREYYLMAIEENHCCYSALYSETTIINNIYCETVRKFEISNGSSTMPSYTFHFIILVPLEISVRKEKAPK